MMSRSTWNFPQDTLPNFKLKPVLANDPVQEENDDEPQSQQRENKVMPDGETSCSKKLSNNFVDIYCVHGQKVSENQVSSTPIVKEPVKKAVQNSSFVDNLSTKDNEIHSSNTREDANSETEKQENGPEIVQIETSGIKWKSGFICILLSLLRVAKGIGCIMHGSKYWIIIISCLIPFYSMLPESRAMNGFCGLAQFYLQTSHDCLPCLAGTYMDELKHDNIQCKQCSIALEFTITKKNCTNTTDTEIECKTGYHRDLEEAHGLSCDKIPEHGMTTSITHTPGIQNTTDDFSTHAPGIQNTTDYDSTHAPGIQNTTDYDFTNAPGIQNTTDGGHPDGSKPTTTILITVIVAIIVVFIIICVYCNFSTTALKICFRRLANGLYKDRYTNEEMQELQQQNSV